MNTVDLILALVFVLAVWAGWRRGFIVGALDLTGLVVGFTTALFGYAYAAAWLERHHASLGVWTLPAAFIGLFLLVRLLFGAAVRSLVVMHPEAHRDPFNRALGMVPGAVNGLIYAAIAAVLLLAAPLADGLSADARSSKAAERLTEYAQRLEARLAPVFGEALTHTMTGLSVEPKSNEFMTLPYTLQNPKPRPDLEEQMLLLVNAERRKAGLDTLKADPALREVARAHSRDMFARGYFAHMSLDSLSPFDRMKRAHVRYLTAGENLALAPTLPLAHTGLMNSPGHRANILQPAFRRVGIGIVDGGMYGMMVTQDFRN